MNRIFRSRWVWMATVLALASGATVYVTQREALEQLGEQVDLDLTASINSDAGRAFLDRKESPDVRLRGVTARQALSLLMREDETPGSVRMALPDHQPQTAVQHTYDVEPIVTMLVARHSEPGPNLFDRIVDWIDRQLSNPTAVCGWGDVGRYTTTPDEQKDALMNLLRITCDLHGWRKHGGLASSVSELKGKLIINAPPDVQMMVYRRLCDVWESLALGRQQVGPADTAVRAATIEQLARPVHTPGGSMHMDKALLALAEAADVSIAVEWPELQAAGLDRGVEVVMPERAASFDQALWAMLEQFGGLDLHTHVAGVSYRRASDAPIVLGLAVNDQGVVLFSTDQAVYDQPDVTIIYNVADIVRDDLVSDGLDPDEHYHKRGNRAERIADLIRNNVNSHNWSAMGGLFSHIERTDTLLVIRASRYDHERIARFLAELRD